jgi:pimeloyl-ACP methyl ester carboxylesterase
MMPFSILRIWLLGLTSMALVVAAGYLGYDWYYNNRDFVALYWVIGLAVFAVGGRFLLIPFVGIGPAPPAVEPLETKSLSRPDGASIHVNVVRKGIGPVIILTHGWSLSSRVWSLVIQRMPESWGVITWDLRGLRQSTRSPAKDYSIDTMAGDLQAVVRLTGGRPVVLIGHSIGGMISQAYCRLYPSELGQSVVGVVLCSTTYINPVHTAMCAPLLRVLQKPLLEPLQHLTIWFSPLVWLMNWQSYLNGTTHLSTRISSFAGAQTGGHLELAARLSTNASPAVVARGMLAMTRLDERDTLPKITVPVLVIAAANDRLTLPEAGRMIAAQVPAGATEVLKPAGHLCLLEQSDELAKAVNEWVTVLTNKSPASRTVA